MLLFTQHSTYILSFNHLAKFSFPEDDKRRRRIVETAFYGLFTLSPRCKCASVVSVALLWILNLGVSAFKMRLVTVCLWAARKSCIFFACTLRSTLSNIYLTKQVKQKRASNVKWLNYQQQWLRWMKKCRWWKKHQTTERQEEAKKRCLKKLRCYTIVYHNKPKQPLLHQAALGTKEQGSKARQRLNILIYIHTK